ncbi:MAG TPA: glycoside hydrolase family 88 protein, partial [Clostridia bacterium]|nr:glycoside hydrolase family 88 protein [Clostridia bacterium]
MERLERQLARQPRTAEGSYWHKLMYSDQVWLDGLYMAQVFRARRAAKNGDERELNDILRQFQMVRAHMYDPALHLYRHAYDASGRAFWADEKGLSRCVWLRAMGWWLAALADAAAVWPASHEGGQWLGACLEEALSGLFPYRDARSGMFLQVVDRACANGNYPETSGSALASYACLRGANTGVLGEGWREEGESVLHAIERE